MIKRLREILKTYQDLEAQMMHPDIMTDMDKLKKV